MIRDWLRHLAGLPCADPVTGHAFVPHPSWTREPWCYWLAGPQADRCFRPERCHQKRRARDPA